MHSETDSDQFKAISDAFKQRDSSDPSIAKKLKILSKARFHPLQDLLRKFLGSEDAFWIELGIKNLTYFKDSITQKEIQLIRKALVNTSDADVKMAAASFWGSMIPKRVSF
ncbi:MAG: hypothetical protein HC933_16375 [Pleurocapsa sp. SU_196_0]|nr:hypothetical protein [Pleurocapsa sp. SU_196_0]